MSMNKKRVVLSIFLLIILMSTFVSAGLFDWFKVLFSGENKVSGYAVAGEENQCDAELNNAIQEIKASLGRLAVAPAEEEEAEEEEEVSCESDNDCDLEAGEKCFDNRCMSSEDLQRAADNKEVPEEEEEIEKDEGEVVCRTNKDCDWRDGERCREGVCVVPQQRGNQARLGLGGGK